MPQANKTPLLKANEAIGEGNIEGFLQFCTEDTNWTFVGDRTLARKETVRRWVVDTYKEPPRFQVHHLIAENDLVTAVGEIKLQDDHGRSVTSSYCDIWRFENGRMAELTAFVVEQ